MLDILLGFLSPLSSKIKLIGLAVLAAIIVGLSFSTLYYRERLESALLKESGVKVQLEQASVALDTCSKNIQSISDETTTKLAEAQLQINAAKAGAQKFVRNANTILITKPVSSDACVSSLALFKDYISSIKVSK